LNTFCLLICRLNANITEWICTQISRNIVNGPKSNKYVLVRIWIIVCIQKPSHHSLQTFRPLRMFKIVFRDSSLYPNSCLYFVCYGWSAWTMPKRWFGKQEHNVKLWRHKQRTSNTNDTIRHWMTVPWKFSAYPTDHSTTLSESVRTVVTNRSIGGIGELVGPYGDPHAQWQVDLPWIKSKIVLSCRKWKLVSISGYRWR